MGGGKSGGGGGGGTQVVKNEPWKGLQGPLKQGYDWLSGSAEQGPPQYYPGQAYAGFAPETEMALQGMSGRALMGSPLTSAAQNELTRTMSGQYLGEGNPYFNNAMNAAYQPLLEKFQQNIAPTIAGQFSLAGRYGSGGHQSALNQATNDLTRNMADAAAKARYGDYNAERQRMTQGMLFAPDLANQDYADLERLGYVGGVREGMQQNAINDSMARWNYNERAPFDWASEYLNVLNSSPFGTQKSTTTGGGGSPFLQTAGGGLSALGAIGTMASLFGK